MTDNTTPDKCRFEDTPDRCKFEEGHCVYCGAEALATRPIEAEEASSRVPTSEQGEGVEEALLRIANTDLEPFRSGDPGKKIQTCVPTPEWKNISKAASNRGVSLSLFLRVAARQYLAWLAAYRSPPEIEAPRLSASPAPASADDRGWLIEEPFGPSTHWIALDPTVRWQTIKVTHRDRVGDHDLDIETYQSPLCRVKDANDALRFARKEDAEAFMALVSPFLLNAFASEHEWPAQAAKPTGSALPAASPIPVTPDEGLAERAFAFVRAIAEADREGWNDATIDEARAIAALRRPTEAADQTRALLSELRELLRQTTNVLALSDKNDPTECIADNGMTVWDGIRLEYERLWPQTTAALSCIDAHLQGPDTDGGQS